MTLNVTMSPPKGGQLIVDGHTYNPRVAYAVGDVVRVKVINAPGFQFVGWRGDVPAGQADQVPCQVTIAEGPQALVAHFQPVVDPLTELGFDADFENGNGILRYNYRDSRALVVEPEQVRGAVNMWWHFKISHVVPGEFVKLYTVHAPISNDSNPVYSYDGETWHRFASTRPPYVQKFEASTVLVARNIPYANQRALALAQALTGDHVQVRNLAVSEAGRPVPMFRFTDPDVPDTDKRIVWVMARLHAFESHSSWYAEHFARWAASDAPLAQALRRQALIYVTPIMDVDNVAVGGSGKEQLLADGARADFNRTWMPDSPWAAVRAAMELLENLVAHHPLAAFIDLHNPWYNDPPHWHIRTDFGEQATAFAALWSRELAAVDSQVQWKHWLRIPDTVDGYFSNEPTDGMVSATKYAAEQLFDAKAGRLCFTIETPHWHDGYGNPITLRSLAAYGQALGRALTYWLQDHGVR